MSKISYVLAVRHNGNTQAYLEEDDQPIPDSVVEISPDDLLSVLLRLTRFRDSGTPETHNGALGVTYEGDGDDLDLRLHFGGGHSIVIPRGSVDGYCRNFERVLRGSIEHLKAASRFRRLPRWTR
jgi:hypothetical protein